MNTFLKIAWRNILRNPRRVSILVIVIALGYVCTLFCMAFVDGYLGQAVDNLIRSEVGHIQIHQQGFHKNPQIHTRIQNPEEIERVLSSETGIRAYAPRIKNQGIASSTESSTGILIMGISPEQEAVITDVEKVLVEGQYLREDDAHSVYIGRALAEKLKVELGDKIVLVGQNTENEVSGGAYRIKGLFQTSSKGLDQSMVYITLSSAQTLFQLPAQVSEYVVLAKDKEQLPVLQAALKSSLAADYEVMTWRELLPSMAQMIDSSSISIYIVVAIIMIAVCFSIVNTLFVVVFERFREFGIMKAMGTRPRHIFALVLFEAWGIALLGLALGGLASVFFVGYFVRNGLDLSAYAQGMAMINTGNIIYFKVTSLQVLASVLSTFLIISLAAAYPAFTAARIEPIKALKFI